MAEEAGRDEDGEPDPQLKSYQIMVRDCDQRRPSGTRRRIPVPHWVYVARKDSLAPKQPEPAKKPRSRAKRTRVQTALKALWKNVTPEQSVLPNALLCKKVQDWLKDDSKNQGVAAQVISDDTILRAAGRK